MSGLGTLGIITMATSRSDQSSPKMPAWVPDWTAYGLEYDRAYNHCEKPEKSFSEGSGMPFFSVPGYILGFDAGGGSKNSNAPEEAKAHLLVRGRLLSTILLLREACNEPISGGCGLSPFSQNGHTSTPVLGDSRD